MCKSVKDNAEIHYNYETKEMKIVTKSQKVNINSYHTYQTDNTLKKKTTLF